ncbi:putative amino acid permease YtnA [Propionispora sp. 2/2-37]|uniref:amino acid permease n=1 Tax=Propionispora sp. 2/2-37 TaxID=1677858 RepID=UPI0006BB7AA9|nr:amino acid permease [Propionispora sp. 2/2-37]CUH94703.1 putative amino acid permease YtnA [Propionispora sp. 2/2-37]
MEKDNALHEDLHRGLEERHIQLIALGGAIGVGLFLGAGAAIKTAGPSLMLVYLFAGIIMFYIMRALGEVAVAYPVSGTFSAHANIFLGPLYGYITGWTYWFMWVVTCMAEITAVGVYVTFWLPEVPQWIPALLALVVMTAVNIISVRAFGEFEFWFALIKIVTILIMIFAGLAMIIFGLGNDGVAIGISNLWTHQGFFPQGIGGMAMACVMVMFSYLGIELVGVTAGEAKNPETSLPAAIDKVFWRILIFYVGALFVIMSLYPWNQIGTMGSPFVLTFNKLGIRAAAGIINFVVLTAALSSCNSGLFSTGRMLYNLALQEKAPAVFKKLSSHQVPVRGILISAVFLLIGVVLNYLVPAQVFTYVTSVATFGALWIWGIILLIQKKYRESLTAEQIKQIKYPMPHAPVSTWLGLAFLIFVVLVMFFDNDTRVALYIAPVWFGIVVASYYVFGMAKDKKE